MKAVRIHGRGGPDRLVYEEAPQPHPGPGEVLVRVYATGVIANELKWGETYENKAGGKRVLPIPGHDRSGVVQEVGSDVTDIARGSEVYALTAFDRDGAEAEYAIALPTELAPKPRTLDHVQAAAVPLTALTAWQAFFDHGDLASGQTVLIHGAAGGVGVFAVQLARLAGAQIIATASAHNSDFLLELGANEIIDYTTTRFEDVVHDVDLVFDRVGGDTLERSWQVVKEDPLLSSPKMTNLEQEKNLGKRGGEMSSTRHEKVYHATQGCQAASLSVTTSRWRGLKWACQVENKKASWFFVRLKRLSPHHRFLSGSGSMVVLCSLKSSCLVAFVLKAHSVDDAYPDVGKRAHGHTRTLALSSLAFVIHLRPGFLPGRLPSK